jgi:hypothetical protein
VELQGVPLLLLVVVVVLGWLGCYQLLQTLLQQQQMAARLLSWVACYRWGLRYVQCSGQLA